MGLRNSVRFAHSGPSHNLLRPAFAELVSCGPRPLPLRGGAQALRPTTLLPTTSGQQADSETLKNSGKGLTRLIIVLVFYFRKDLGEGIFVLLNQRIMPSFSPARYVMFEVINLDIDGQAIAGVDDLVNVFIIGVAPLFVR